MSDREPIQVLIERLRDPWKPIRNEAAQQLFERGEEAIPFLAPLLEHPDDDLAQYAVWVLERLDTPETLALLDRYWSGIG